MRRPALILAPILLSTPLLAACPNPPDRSTERTALLGDLKAAETIVAGQAAVQQMWLFWRQAPDEPAQSLLDSGLDAIRYGDLLRAQQTFEKLTEYCPAFAEGWNQLAFTFFLQDQDTRSIAALERTLALEPAHFGALAGLALIHIRGGRPALAQIWLRKAVAVNPWLNERHLLEQSPTNGSDL